MFLRLVLLEPFIRERGIVKEWNQKGVNMSNLQLSHLDPSGLTRPLSPQGLSFVCVQETSSRCGDRFIRLGVLTAAETLPPWRSRRWLFRPGYCLSSCWKRLAPMKHESKSSINNNSFESSSASHGAVLLKRGNSPSHSSYTHTHTLARWAKETNVKNPQVNIYKMKPHYR